MKTKKKAKPARKGGAKRSPRASRAPKKGARPVAQPAARSQEDAAPPPAEETEGSGDEGDTRRTPATPTAAGVLNVDPNVRWSGKVVRVTFGRWCYRASVVARVGGNTQGFSVLETAVEDAFDNRLEKVEPYTPDDADEAVHPRKLMLANEKGETLLMDDILDEDELKEMVVAVELVGIEPDEPEVQGSRGHARKG